MVDTLRFTVDCQPRVSHDSHCASKTQISCTIHKAGYTACCRCYYYLVVNNCSLSLRAKLSSALNLDMCITHGDSGLWVTIIKQWFPPTIATTPIVNAFQSI